MFHQSAPMSDDGSAARGQAWDKKKTAVFIRRRFNPPFIQFRIRPY
jgi:hypothetical protein